MFCHDLVYILTGNVLFTIEDGWGVGKERGASVGSVEIRAWCCLGRPTQTAVMLGPSVANEQLEILLPGLLWGEIFVSVKVCIIGQLIKIFKIK